MIDGDGQNPPETVLGAFRLMQETGAEVAKGRRVTRADGLYRRFVSFGFNTLFLRALPDAWSLGHQRQAQGCSRARRTAGSA